MRGYRPIGTVGTGAGQFATSEGNSVVTVTDAAGVVIATVDPATRQRRDLRGRVIGHHEILSARNSFVAALLRPRQAGRVTGERPAVVTRGRGRPRKMV